MSEIAIKLNGITKLFPSVRALDNVSFQVNKGDVHCIIGENGAGKSTLMKILSGVQAPDEGSFELFGKPANFANPRDAIDAGVGIVYQELSNFSHLDVAQNLFAGSIPRKNGLIDYKTLYGNARNLLDSFGLEEINEKAVMNEISLGQQQMVEIASILHQDAKIVILDEPTSALTEAEAMKLFGLIRQLKKQKVTILYISHRLDEILVLANEITVLKDGTYVTTMKNSPDITRDLLVQHMVGRDVQYEYGVGTTKIGDDLMELHNFTSGETVKDVNFTLRKGEILGVAGLEGAGRTELLEALFGARPSTGGSVSLNGETIKIDSPIDAKKHKIAYITKERSHKGLFQMLSVRQNIVAADWERFAPHGILNYNEQVVATDEYIDKVQVVTSSQEALVSFLSGGNQQKVLLAMWLLTQPEVLLIDEPTRGVDVGAKAEIHSILRDIVGEDKGVVMVSSEATELLASCDRIMVMFEGKVAGILDNKDATEEKIIRLASGLTIN